PAFLVARRDDLDDGHHLAAGVADGDAACFPGVPGGLGARHKPGFRRLDVDGQTFGRVAGRRGPVEGDGVPLGAARLLLDHGEIAGGQPALVEGIGDRDHPALVKVMESVGTDARPVVDRHGEFLRSVNAETCPELYHPSPTFSVRLWPAIAYPGEPLTFPTRGVRPMRRPTGPGKVKDNLNLPPARRQGVTGLLYNFDIDDASLKKEHQD